MAWVPALCLTGINNPCQLLKPFLGDQSLAQSQDVLSGYLVTMVLFGSKKREATGKTVSNEFCIQPTF